MGKECRLGYQKDDVKSTRPFSGVTACVDFCAHAHKDLHNMNNGCTVVVTLTKHGPMERPEEEQLHVLPLYILDLKETDFNDKLQRGCIEILSNYPKVAHIRATPVTPKRKGKGKKESPSNKKDNTSSHTASPAKSSLLNSKNTNTSLMSQVSNNSKPELSTKYPKTAISNISGFNNIVNKINLFQNTTLKNIEASSSKVQSERENCISSVEKSLHRIGPLETPMSMQFNNGNTYDKFWKYFYSHGAFPPANFLKDDNSPDTMNILANQSVAVDKDSKQGPLFRTQDKSIGSPSLPHQFRSTELPKKFDNINKMVPDVLMRPGPACSVPFSNPNVKKVKRPYSLSSLTSDDFESPLHLLSEAVMIRSQTAVEKTRAVSSQQTGVNISTPRKPTPNSELTGVVMGATNQGVINFSNHLPKQSYSNAKMPVELSKDQHSRFSSLNSNFDRKDIFDNVNSKLCRTSISSYSIQSNKGVAVQPSSNIPFSGENGSRADCPDGCMRDSNPEVISSELEYNEQNFNDPAIGGVAIALTHGSVLFEVAKRELHATTALLNPNRYSPTRISLVFYQHKSMNQRYHGWYENERKLELQRQKRLQKMKEETGKNNPVPNTELKPGSKKRRKKEEEPVVNCAAKYKYMWETSIKHTVTHTTDSVITQSIDPQTTVTGPYQKWICQ